MAKPHMLARPGAPWPPVPFLIRDKTTGVVLFIGRVVDPR